MTSKYLRVFSLLALVVLGSLLPSVVYSAETRIQSSKPNVLFLICDDLNCDMSTYGHATVQTPNIDRLAARGVRFENAHCQFPLCGPSRISFMTGMYPDQTLVHRNSIYVREHTPNVLTICLLYTSPSPRDQRGSRMPSSA